MKLPTRMEWFVGIHPLRKMENKCIPVTQNDADHRKWWRRRHLLQHDHKLDLHHEDEGNNSRFCAVLEYDDLWVDLWVDTGESQTNPVAGGPPRGQVPSSAEEIHRRKRGERKDKSGGKVLAPQDWTWRGPRDSFPDGPVFPGKRTGWAELSRAETCARNHAHLYGPLRKTFRASIFQGEWRAERF